MTDWELWACANQLRKQHGIDAFTVVWKRLDELERADDREGYQVWLEISVRLAKLGPEVDPDATRH